MKEMRRSLGVGSLVLLVLLSAWVRPMKGRGADDTNCKDDSVAESYMIDAVVMALQVNPPRMAFVIETLERHRREYPQGKLASSREALLKRIGEFQNPQ